MATGRSTKLTGQVGEFLVCAELGRRGVLATPFSGNVPGFDVIATGPGMITVPIQVKASNGTNWQTSMDKWLDVEFEAENQRLILHGPRKLDREDLIHVYVALSRERGDRFYVLTAADVQQLVEEEWQRRLGPRGGRRPRKPDSMHWAIRERQLLSVKDRWDLIVARLQ